MRFTKKKRTFPRFGLGSQLYYGSKETQDDPVRDALQLTHILYHRIGKLYCVIDVDQINNIIENGGKLQKKSIRVLVLQPTVF